MGLKEGGESPQPAPIVIARADLAYTIGMLNQLSIWFEEFGNYTRANDCRRLVDGINLYTDDIIGGRR